MVKWQSCKHNQYIFSFLVHWIYRVYFIHVENVNIPSAEWIPKDAMKKNLKDSTVTKFIQSKAQNVCCSCDVILKCSSNWSGTYFVNQQTGFELAVVPCLWLPNSEILGVCLGFRAGFGYRILLPIFKAKADWYRAPMEWGGILSSILLSRVGFVLACAGRGLVNAIPTSVDSYAGSRK